MSNEDQSTSPESEVTYRTIVGRIKGVPEVKTDSRQKQYASLAIVVPGSENRTTGEEIADEWFNIAAYGEKAPAKLAATFAAGDNVIAVIAQHPSADGSTFNRLQAIGANTYLEDVEIHRRPKADRRQLATEPAPAVAATPSL